MAHAWIQFNKNQKFVDNLDWIHPTTNPYAEFYCII